MAVALADRIYILRMLSETSQSVAVGLFHAWVKNTPELLGGYGEVDKGAREEQGGRELLKRKERRKKGLSTCWSCCWQSSLPKLMLSDAGVVTIPLISAVLEHGSGLQKQLWKPTISWLKPLHADVSQATLSACPSARWGPAPTMAGREWPVATRDLQAPSLDL